MHCSVAVFADCINLCFMVEQQLHHIFISAVGCAMKRSDAQLIISSVDIRSFLYQPFCFARYPEESKYMESRPVGEVLSQAKLLWYVHCFADVVLQYRRPSPTEFVDERSNEYLSCLLLFGSFMSMISPIGSGIAEEAPFRVSGSCSLVHVTVINYFIRHNNREAGLCEVFARGGKEHSGNGSCQVLFGGLVDKMNSAGHWVNLKETGGLNKQDMFER
jgi:hypothetical protein